MSSDAPDGTTPRWAVRDCVLVAIAPVVLVAIALVAIVRFHTDAQSSWQGVGFGMFATYDNVTSRSVRILVDGERVAPPSALTDDVERAKTRPLGTGPGDIADAVARIVPGADVRVEVWRIVIDAGDEVLEVRVEPIVRVEAKP